MQPYDRRDKPFSAMRTTGWREGDIGDFPKRKPGHQPASAHPWRNPKPEESEPGEPIHRSIGEDGNPQPRSSRDVGVWSPNWRGTSHRLYGTKSIPFAGFDDRFSQSPSPIVQHVKDGRPLTERGAELLKATIKADTPELREAYRSGEMRPLDIVVSPAGKPAHSLQKQQIHSYQQTQGRK